MAIKFKRSPTATFETNGTVTAAKLHNLVDATDIYQALITDQTNLTSVGSTDELLIADADLSASDAPRAVTVNELFEDALTISTYTNANINNISHGTSTGTRLVATNASITTGTIPSLTSSTASITIGTIPTLTAGTTTSTAANITNGTIQTLTSSTATITGGTFSGSVNSTSGTIGSFNSTNGTIQSLTSSTATISDIATGKNFAINVGTLATASGTQNLDFTSQGYLTHSITGNITYTASNYAAGKSLTIRITSDGATRNLTFPTSWIFVGAKPTSIAASKVAVLSVTSFGATEENCVAAYAVQT